MNDPPTRTSSRSRHRHVRRPCRGGLHRALRQHLPAGPRHAPRPLDGPGSQGPPRGDAPDAGRGTRQRDDADDRRCGLARRPAVVRRAAGRARQALRAGRLPLGGERVLGVARLLGGERVDAVGRRLLARVLARLLVQPLLALLGLAVELRHRRLLLGVRSHVTRPRLPAERTPDPTDSSGARSRCPPRVGQRAAKRQTSPFRLAACETAARVEPERDEVGHAQRQRARRRSLASRSERAPSAAGRCTRRRRRAAAQGGRPAAHDEPPTTEHQPSGPPCAAGATAGARSRALPRPARRRALEAAQPKSTRGQARPQRERVDLLTAARRRADQREAAALVERRSATGRAAGRRRPPAACAGHARVDPQQPAVRRAEVAARLRVVAMPVADPQQSPRVAPASCPPWRWSEARPRSITRRRLREPPGRVGGGRAAARPRADGRRGRRTSRTAVRSRGSRARTRSTGGRAGRPAARVARISTTAPQVGGRPRSNLVPRTTRIRPRRSTTNSRRSRRDRDEIGSSKRSDMDAAMSAWPRRRGHGAERQRRDRRRPARRSAPASAAPAWSAARPATSAIAIAAASGRPSSRGDEAGTERGEQGGDERRDDGARQPNDARQAGVAPITAGLDTAWATQTCSDRYAAARQQAARGCALRDSPGRRRAAGAVGRQAPS